MFLAGGTLWIIHGEYKTHLSQQISGELVAPPGPSSSFPEIYIGNSKGRVTWKSETGDGQVLAGFEDTGVVVERIDGKLYLTAKVLGEDGNLIVNVYKNKWEINASEVLDKNYTSNALEVFDKRGTVVLQVVLTSDRVKIQGEWWSESGTGIRLVEVPHSDDGEMMKLHKGLVSSQPFVRAMFQYPSEEHQGEFLK